MDGKEKEEEKKRRQGSEKRRRGGWWLVCLATGADPVIRERLGIVVAAAPGLCMEQWMAPTKDGWMAPTKEDIHSRGYPLKRIPTKEDTH